jgi:LEA14-like dessication related protein
MRTVVLLTLPLVLSACQKVDLGKVDVKKYLPKVTFDRMKVAEVDWSGMRADFTFDVENPYPVGLKLKSFAYDLALEEQQFLNSASDAGLDLGAASTSQMVLPARIEFADVFALVKDLQGKDDIGFRINGNFGVDTPIGPVTVPFDESGRMPTLKAPKIKPTAVRVGKVNLMQQSATLEIDLGVTNRALDAVYGLKDMGYGLDLGGTRIATGNLAEVAVAAGQTETVTLPVTVNLLSLGSTLVSAITQKKALDVRVDASMSVDTPLGGIPLSIDETTNLQLR